MSRRQLRQWMIISIIPHTKGRNTRMGASGRCMTTNAFVPAVMEGTDIPLEAAFVDFSRYVNMLRFTLVTLDRKRYPWIMRIYSKIKRPTVDNEQTATTRTVPERGLVKDSTTFTGSPNFRSSRMAMHPFSCFVYPPHLESGCSQWHLLNA